MKKRLLLLAALCVSLLLSAQKINLTMNNLVNVSARGNMEALIDEQNLAGSGSTPACSTCPTTIFQAAPGGAAYVNMNLYYPLEVIIDLWGDYSITNFYYYDVAGSDSIFISVGTPAAWTPIIKGTTSGYNTWHSNPINKTTRYLQLKLKSPSTSITEIVLYGTAVGTIIPPSPPTTPALLKPAMEDLIGMNSFHDVPDSIQKVVKNIREYHNWGWDEGDNTTTYPGFPNNQYAFNPSWAGGNSWNFDVVYTRMAKQGQIISPVLQGDALYIMNFVTSGSTLLNKPIKNNVGNPLDPASYKEHADYMFQYAARYGSTAVPAAKLKVRSTNSALSGLGLIKYMENWNEPDKDWDGRAPYFKPFELAAMSSADCDGHKGALGATYGMKAADPKMKFVQSGLINIDTLVIKAMVFWHQFFRNGSIPFDVINFHHYSNDAGGQGGSATKGITPEADNLKVKVQEMVNYRNKNLPGVEVWFSEFGYDTNPTSIQSAKAVGSQDAWEVQARWILRSFLAYAAGGADKAHMYMSRDVDASSITYNTSGLTTPSSNGTYKAYTKKKSWYYVYTFNKRLKGYRFKQEISSGNTNVLIYSFENIKDPSKLIYAVWAPTYSDLTVSNYSLALPSNVASATKIEIMNKDTTGVETTLPISNKATTISVDEKPDLIYITTSVPLSVDPETQLANNASFNVYPNPFGNSVKVACSSVENITGVMIRDVRGTLLKSFTAYESAQTMDLEGLAKGVYLLEGTTDKNVYVTKIIKN